MAKDKVTPKRLDKDTDRRLRALDRSVHADEAKAARKARRQKGSVHRALVVVVAGLGLAGWGWAHGSSAPDGRWLLAVVIVGTVLALFVLAGRRYHHHDQRDAAYTARIEGRLEQDTTGDHIWDGA